MGLSCEVCGKAFGLKWRLEKHARTHETESKSQEETDQDQDILQVTPGLYLFGFFSFRISSGDGESCPGCIFFVFLQLYCLCLAWFSVCALKTDFFSTIWALKATQGARILLRERK